MANSLTYQNKTFSVGDTIQVYQKVKEDDKVRSQMFEGILISVRGREKNTSFTVRKIASAGIGVERIWPLYSPMITNITLKKTGKTRRAKLYYLRGRSGKQATRIKEKKTNPETSQPTIKASQKETVSDKQTPGKKGRGVGKKASSK